MIRIVGVHGVGAYRPEPPDTVAAGIAAEWTEALADSEHLPLRADEFELRIAYYGHLLREPGSDDGAGIDPRVGAMIGDFLKAIAPDPEDITGSWLPREAAAKLTELFGWNEALSMGFLGLFFGDVAAFMRDEGDFTPAPMVVSKVGADLAGADIVIAHSLGSIVAYEALWAHPTDLPLLVTIGSPLAMPIVFPHLDPEPVDGKGAKPPCVERWINIADHGDVVAGPPGGVGERFKGVDRDVHDDIDAPLFHDESYYLRSRQLGLALADWDVDPQHV